MGNKDPEIQLNRFLKSYRSTPHPTTGEILAEILFGRKFFTKIADIRNSQTKEREDIKRAQDKDKESKEIQKKYKDSKANVTEHKIQVVDKVMKERKSTKYTTPYDPVPYTVIEVHGSQITARRGEEIKIRDSQRFKRVELSKRKTFRRQEIVNEEDADVGCPVEDLNLGEQGEEAGAQAVEQEGARDVQTAAQDPGQGLGAQAGVQEGVQFRTLVEV